MFINARTYYYAVLACKSIKVARVDLALVIRAILPVGVVEGVEVVVIDVVDMKDIGDESQE